MIGDDLVPLLSQGPGPGLRFRQGEVVTWNSNTGENVIQVGGAFFENVPILNTGEAIALKAGHIVGLLAFQSSYWILGRITVPGQSDFASASVAFGGEGASEGGFAITTTHTDHVTDTMPVPDWADEAIVLCTVNAVAANSSASVFFVNIQAAIDGIGGGSSQFGVAALGDASLNYVNSGSASAQRRITNPGPTISLAGRVWVDSGTIPATANNHANLDAIAIFRSTV